jgi:hypothetical protein
VCFEKKIDDGRYKTDVAWIPEKYAKTNNIVKVKQNDGSWEGGWIVEFVSFKVEASRVEIAERDYRKQRKVSDI